MSKMATQCVHELVDVGGTAGEDFPISALRPEDKASYPWFPQPWRSARINIPQVPTQNDVGEETNSPVLLCSSPSSISMALCTTAFPWLPHCLPPRLFSNQT